MSTVEVVAITIDPQMGLLVRPVAGHCYEHIYRVANGLRWNGQQSSIVAYEPQHWAAIELAKHIAKTVHAEYGDLLRLSNATYWGEVDSSTQLAIKQAFNEAAP